MSKVETKTMAKGSIVQDTIQEENQGLTAQGKAFLDLYLSRVNAGKALANAGATLREAKSEENLCFWGAKYAVEKTGFGGKVQYCAPPFVKSVFEERLKVLGWNYKRLPSAQKIYCKQHGLEFTTFMLACLQQEEASRKAGQTAEKPLDLPFRDETIADILSYISDECPAGKVFQAVEVKVKKRLAEM